MENDPSSVRVEGEAVLDVPDSILPKRKRRPRWEKRLPSHYVVASVPGKNSLQLTVEIQTTDTGKRIQILALLDCGATGLFINSALVREKGLTTRTLQRPIPVYNVDGSPNEAGSITEVVDLVLRYKDHSERAVFAVTNLGKQDMILGLTWLREHNPEVDWKTGEINMSHCPQHCCTCFLEEKQKKRVDKRKGAKLEICREGSMPQLVKEDEEDDDDEDKDEEWEQIMRLGVEEEDEEWELEEGDRIFCAVLRPENEGRVRTSPKPAEEHI
jgi:hypothetical protein